MTAGYVAMVQLLAQQRLVSALEMWAVATIKQPPAPKK